MKALLRSKHLTVLALLVLLALRPASPAQAQLADSPWPMFHHDLQHTGRSPYIGPTYPALKWSFTTGGAVNSSPSVGADGTVYVGSSDKKLYALNPDGTLKWSFATANGVHSSPAIGSDGTIYVGSSYAGTLDPKFYAINPDGTLKWSALSFVDAYWGVSSSPAIGADGTIYVGSHSNNFYALNPDGSTKWSFPTGDWTSSSPAVGTDGTIYVCSQLDHTLWAVNPDGTQKWTANTESECRTSPSIGADGTVYVGGYIGKLFAINPDGSQKWTLGIGGFGPMPASPAVGTDGTVYVGSNTQKLYAINPDGTVKWTFPTGDGVDSSPAIGADGSIYVGSYDKKLYAVNPDGTLKWSFPTGSYVYSSPAIGADGTVYVGSADGKLYALREAVPAAVGNLWTGVDTDGASGVAVAIPQVIDALNGQPVPGVLIGAYEASLAYPGALVNVLDVRLKPPFDSGTFNITNPAGSTALLAYAALGAPWPLDPLAFLPLRLPGCADQPATVTLTFTGVFDFDGDTLGLPPPVTRTFMRGDAKADGVISAADVLYILQRVVGLRPAGDGPGQVNAVNAASVKQDGAFDQITAADALELAQLLAGLRDPCFRLPEFLNIAIAVDVMLAENLLTSIPNPYAANDAPCTVGTKDMSKFPDPTSDAANGGKVTDPFGNAYNYAGTPPDKPGYILLLHDMYGSGAGNDDGVRVNYVSFPQTVFCYKADNLGTIHQYLEDGTEIHW